MDGDAQCGEYYMGRKLVDTVAERWSGGLALLRFRGADHFDMMLRSRKAGCHGASEAQVQVYRLRCTVITCLETCLLRLAVVFSPDLVQFSGILDVSAEGLSYSVNESAWSLPLAHSSRCQPPDIQPQLLGLPLVSP